MKCLLVDDDKNSRQVIRQMLSSDFPFLELDNEAGSLNEALEICNLTKPELVFLDIQLGDGSGFEFLELVNHKAFKVIFITGLSTFAMQAFKVNAVDYIMKPINKTELVTAVNKSFHFPIFHEIQTGVRKIMETLNWEFSRIALPTRNGFQFYNIEDLLLCISDGNYTRFIFKEIGEVLVSRTMGSYEELLERRDFCRIHASYIINLREISSFEKSDGGVVVLSDGSQWEVARTKRVHFLQKLKQIPGFFNT